IGEGRVVKDLEDGLVGMTPGEEKEIDVTFPDDYFSADIAGQKVLFKVKLNEIKEEILPELNDAFAKGIGDRFQSLSELKDTIRENLKSGYEKRSEQELNEQIFSHLLSQSEFEVPESMVTSELEHIVKDAEQSFEYSNKTMEELGLTAESMADKYRPVAEKQVRRHLILSKLIDQESLVLTDDELEQGLEQMAKNYGQPVASLKAFYDKDPKSMNFFKHTLLEKKALKIIIDNSTIETVEPEKEASSEQAE
ncbi:MAG: trigger factor, partial [Desulfatitalea sp.]|nr:trigger factor [Desulfatitalea sp.]